MRQNHFRQGPGAALGISLSREEPKPSMQMYIKIIRCKSYTLSPKKFANFTFVVRIKAYIAPENENLLIDC
jgi:hypothetical protein